MSVIPESVPAEVDRVEAVLNCLEIAFARGGLSAAKRVCERFGLGDGMLESIAANVYGEWERTALTDRRKSQRGRRRRLTAVRRTA